MDDQEIVEAIVTAVKGSKKYGDVHETTIRELAETAVPRYPRRKEAEKAVRRWLHKIVAPYLGDPDYEEAKADLDAAFAAGDPAAIKQTCAAIMNAHVSTRERLPLLNDFFRQIFAVTGRPRRILDVACGLDPLSFPWMGLEPPIDFYAYDIHEPRIDFLNHYFRLQGLPPLARVQDVAFNVPEEEGDAAFFFKELPRFARYYGDERVRPLLDGLHVPWLVLSFPAVSAHSGRDLTGRYRDFMADLAAGRPWQVTERLFPGELVFCVKK